MKLPPLETRRKAGLGRYHGTRKEWKASWRRARGLLRLGRDPDPKDKGLNWKASLIACYERSGNADPLTFGLVNRLNAKRCVDHLFASMNP